MTGGFVMLLMLFLGAVVLVTTLGRRRSLPPPGSQQAFQPYGAQSYGAQPYGGYGQPAQQVDPSAAIKATDEDITTFGDELRDLDLDVVGHQLDTATQQDYQRALDAYEHAKDSLAQVRVADDVRHVTQILEDGRYAIACVKARVAGQPLPVKRPPCFFNPAHGPSTQNVSWAPAGGSVREIPACAADAERVLAGADPYIRTVPVGAARVPYWQDASYAPYAQGYYSNWQTDQVVRGLAIGTAVFAGLTILPHLMSGIGDLLDGDFHGGPGGFDGFDGFDGDFDF